MPKNPTLVNGFEDVLTHISQLEHKALKLAEEKALLITENKELIEKNITLIKQLKELKDKN